jgi:hypothetical protein
MVGCGSDRVLEAGEALLAWGNLVVRLRRMGIDNFWWSGNNRGSRKGFGGWRVAPFVEVV